MPVFSKESLENIATCHPLLQMVAFESIRSTDFKIVYGRRTVAEQLSLMRRGLSKVKDPRSSLHVADSPELARAFDAAPYVSGRGVVDGNHKGDLRYFYYMIGQIRRTAFDLDVPIQSGGDWDKDGNFDDQSFNDLYHIQLDVKECVRVGLLASDGRSDGPRLKLFLESRDFHPLSI